MYIFIFIRWIVIFSFWIHWRVFLVTIALILRIIVISKNRCVLCSYCYSIILGSWINGLKLKVKVIYTHLQMNEICRYSYKFTFVVSILFDLRKLHLIFVILWLIELRKRSFFNRLEKFNNWFAEPNHCHSIVLLYLFK